MNYLGMLGSIASILGLYWAVYGNKGTNISSKKTPYIYVIIFIITFIISILLFETGTNITGIQGDDNDGNSIIIK